MFQEDRVADADRLLRTVVRKNPTYAGNTMQHPLALLHCVAPNAAGCMWSALLIMLLARLTCFGTVLKQENVYCFAADNASTQYLCTFGETRDHSSLLRVYKICLGVHAVMTAAVATIVAVSVVYSVLCTGHAAVKVVQCSSVVNVALSKHSVAKYWICCRGPCSIDCSAVAARAGSQS